MKYMVIFNRFVLPTHVGVIPLAKGLIKAINSTTHTRGGDPGSVDLTESMGGYYPHTWG